MHWVVQNVAPGRVKNDARELRKQIEKIVGEGFLMNPTEFTNFTAPGLVSVKVSI